MFIWITNGKVLVTSPSEIVRDDCIIVERDDFTDDEKTLIRNGAEISDEWVVVSTETIVNKIATDKEKAKVLEVASLYEQVNLTAWVLDIVVDTISSDYPDILTNEWVITSKTKLEEIKTLIS